MCTGGQQTNKHNNELTIYTDQSFSWEADSSSASQEIRRILWNFEGHYCSHNSPSFLFVVR